MQLSTTVTTNRFGESYLPAINASLFADHSAHQRFEQALDPQFWREDTCHLVIGSDSGLLIEHVHRHGVPAGSCYLFIEPQHLQATVSTLAQAALAANPALRVCNGNDWVAVATPLGLETYILKQRIFIYSSLGANSDARAAYAPLLQQVSNTLDNTAYTTKLCLVDKALIEQVLRNVAENDLPVAQLRGRFQGRTAIILGAGPSLREHLDWIKQHRSQLVVIAAARLSKLLLAEDLIPDMVVSIDHQPLNFELSRDVLRLPPQVVLLNASSVSPALLAQWRGARLYTGERLPWHSDLNSDNLQDQCGPTVANNALVVAGALGFSRILLSGVDLCSPRDGQTHVVGDDLKEQPRRTHPVATYSGVTALANVQMVFAAQNLAQQAQRLTATRVLNLAPLAARVDGIEHCPPAQIDWPPAPPGEPVTALVPLLDVADRQASLTQVVEELTAVLRQLKTIERLCEDALALNRKIYRRDQQGNYNLRAKDKLDNLQQRLDNEFGHLAVIIKKTGMAFFINAMTTRDLHQFSDADLERQGRHYYRAYRDAAHLLAERVDDSLRRVQSRLAEDRPDTTLADLAARWRADGHTGRALIWRDRHPQRCAALGDADRDLLAALEREFEASLAPPELVGPRPNQFWRLRQRLSAYFGAGNHGQLQAVLASIESTLADRPRGRDLMALGRGYAALLEGDRSQALHHLRQTAPGDRDDALLQLLAALAVEHNDPDTAEAALQQLARNADEFLPQYANLLKYNNKVAEAANEYTGYLQRHPEDIPTWLALAQLYREAGEPELARAVYDYVLQQDPDNTTAQAFMNS